MTVRLRIKELRENHPEKPSQRTLGDVLGIAEANYRNLENGKSKTVSLEALDRLCKFFDCTHVELFEYIKD